MTMTTTMRYKIFYGSDFEVGLEYNNIINWTHLITCGVVQVKTEDEDDGSEAIVTSADHDVLDDVDDDVDDEEDEFIDEVGVSTFRFCDISC